MVKGVKAAMQRVDTRGLPVLAIGYSRGGGLVVEYGAFAKQNGLPVPNAIMAVFPAGQGDERRIVPLTGLDPKTAILLQTGEDDNVVAGGGARFLLGRLQAAGFPANRVQTDFVRSQKGLVANHFAPLQTTPAAKAEFWARRRPHAQRPRLAHAPAVRIIAGSRKGHTIQAPKGLDTRPTSDRTREAAFNLIGPVDGARVLDLYAGSGAMGLEALSRGASQAVFVESRSRRLPDDRAEPRPAAADRRRRGLRRCGARAGRRRGRRTAATT